MLARKLSFIRNLGVILKRWLLPREDSDLWSRKKEIMCKEATEVSLSNLTYSLLKYLLEAVQHLQTKQ